MFGNPYGQGGWFNLQTNGLPLPDQRLSPTFGALPHYIPVLSPNIITFVFSSPDQDILNCDVTDASFQKSYKVMTNKRGLGDTIIRRADGETSGAIDWQRHPEVEVFRSFHKQRASSLLQLNPDGRCVISIFDSHLAIDVVDITWHDMTFSRGRFMDLRGKRYIWKISNEVTSVSLGELNRECLRLIAYHNSCIPSMVTRENH